MFLAFAFPLNVKNQEKVEDAMKTGEKSTFRTKKAALKFAYDALFGYLWNRIADPTSHWLQMIENLDQDFLDPKEALEQLQEIALEYSEEVLNNEIQFHGGIIEFF